MPAGTFVIGHKHLTEHWNICLSGKAAVMMNGELRHIVAPCVFMSEIGVRKVLFIEEDMRWMTVHVTNETDIKKLEDELIVKSEAFKKFHGEMESLANALEQDKKQPFQEATRDAIVDK